MLSRNAFLLVVISTWISTVPLSGVNGQETYSTASLEMTVFRDGVVRIDHNLIVNETLPFLTLPLLTTPVENVFVIDQAGFPVGFEVQQRSLAVNTLGSTKVRISYDTTAITSKDGRLWSTRFATPVETKLTLPEMAVAVSLSDLPLSVAIRNNRTILTLSSGTWEMTYILPITSQPQPTVTRTVTQTTTMTTAETQTQTVTKPPPTTTVRPTVTITLTTPARTTATISTPSNGFAGMPIALILLATVVGAGGVLGATLWWRRHSSPKASADEFSLRPDEKEILQYIASKGGRVLEAELRQKFVLPKTSEWRLVRRLERMGYVKVRKVGLQNEIELVKGV